MNKIGVKVKVAAWLTGLLAVAVAYNSCGQRLMKPIAVEGDRGQRAQSPTDTGNPIFRKFAFSAGGATEYIDCANDLSAWSGANSEFSISFWHKVENIRYFQPVLEEGGTSSWQDAYSDLPNDFSKTTGLVFQATEDQYRANFFYAHHPGVTVQWVAGALSVVTTTDAYDENPLLGFNSFVHQPEGAFSPNDWHHFLISFGDPASVDQNYNLFIDGKLVHSARLEGRLTWDKYERLQFSTPFAQTQSFDGLYSDFAVWQMGLNGDESLAVYDGFAGSVEKDLLLSHWAFGSVNDINVPVVYDSVANRVCQGYNGAKIVEF